MARLTIRVDFASGALGPGKIGLLESVAETGSIRKAASRMKMSFRQAWLLLQAVEEMCGEPVIEALRGGQGGGGARLTELGQAVIRHYRSLEKLASGAAEGEVAALESRFGTKRRKSPTVPPKGRALGKSLKKKR